METKVKAICNFMSNESAEKFVKFSECANKTNTGSLHKMDEDGFNDFLCCTFFNNEIQQPDNLKLMLKDILGWNDDDIISNLICRYQTGIGMLGWYRIHYLKK